jgi:CheY-like chemotaxis protein
MGAAIYKLVFACNSVPSLFRLMTDSQKLVLMIQPSRLQGLIWQAVLKSQGIAVIWESSDINLPENLDQLKAAGLTLPNLLLIDVRLPDFNPYNFSRWCRQKHAEVKIVFTNSAQPETVPSERQWAIHQGACDLLPGFQRDNLVSQVTIAVKRVLEILDSHPLDNGALISVLLSMKRQLEAVRSDLGKNNGLSEMSKQLRHDRLPSSSRSASEPSQPKDVIPQQPSDLPTAAVPPAPRKYRGIIY